MKSIATLFSVLMSICVIQAQDLYSKAFGNPEHTPVVFLHGGPGYNSANFEATTALKLAEEGFYVIVYDRRGEGRSASLQAEYTFEQTHQDLLQLYETYQLEKASLIGHSFGGMVATLFAEAHPDKVESIILVGAPIVIQETFQTILARSKAIYQTKKDSVNLNYISLLENMDSTSIQYSSYCFAHAMQNGFYTPKQLSEEAKAIYAQFRTDPMLIEHASKMSYQAPMGFWQNEAYTTLDLSSNLNNLVQADLPIYALYGKEDGLFSAQQVDDLSALIGSDQLHYLEDCSHNVFIDQQVQFIEALKAWLQ